MPALRYNEEVLARPLSILSCCGALLGVTPSWAQPTEPPFVEPSSDERDKLACVESHEQAQELRNARRLLAARAELIACARETCPPLARRDCGRWLEEVETALPTVVLEYRDARGPRSEVEVLVDGVALLTRLDGTAVAVDPGERVFRFLPSGGEPVERRVLVLEGGKSQRVTVDLAPPERPLEPEVPDEPAPSIHPVTWALGGLSLVGFGLFATFGGVSLATEDELRASCAPNCELDALERERAAADVSLAVGAAAGVAALIVGLTVRYEPGAPAD